MKKQYYINLKAIFTSTDSFMCDINFASLSTRIILIIEIIYVSFQSLKANSSKSKGIEDTRSIQNYPLI